MLVLVLLSLIASGERSIDIVTETVDLIELNHVYDPKGHLIFDQVVFYERNPKTGRFQVRGWCMVEDNDVINRRPVRNHSNGLYLVDWLDKDCNVHRRITSRTYRESWTQDDVEREDKKVHPERLRIGFVRRPRVID